MQEALAPKAARDRIDVLDVLRGLAILLIFPLNLPVMGQTFLAADPRLLGWGPLDQVAWWVWVVPLEGTQRGLLQLLFGAGAAILLERTMRPDGPLAVADLYFRRTLWLAAFGLADILLLLWLGDILLMYSIASLLLFPVRRLGPRALIGLTLAWVAVVSAQGSFKYREAATIQAGAAEATARAARGEDPGEAGRKALDGRKAQLEGYRSTEAALKAERAAHTGSAFAYARSSIGTWYGILLPQYYPRFVAEAFFTMLLGMALFKLGVLQGRLSAGSYAILAAVAYAFGLAIRAVDARQLASEATMAAHVGQFLGQPARLAVVLGHLSLVNWLMKGPARRLLDPLRAVGRTAFSVYLMQNFLGMYVLFAPFGLGLWGRFGWAGLMAIAVGVIAVQVVLANLWLRRFAIGPMEWLWRSLTYRQWQPLRRRPTELVATGLPA